MRVLLVFASDPMPKESAISTEAQDSRAVQGVMSVGKCGPCGEVYPKHARDGASEK